MAHFAQVDDMNVVQQVVVVSNDAIDGGTFPASEALGQAFLAECGIEGKYLQCSYSGSFRGTYPGIGYSYDPDLDVFVPPVTANG